jgi:hypothetical protein
VEVDAFWSRAAPDTPALFPIRAELARSAKDTEELADLMLALEGMSERELAMHLVLVSPADSRSADVAGVDEIAHDRLCRAQSDADALGDVANADPRILRHADEHVSVIREERPRTRLIVAIGHAATHYLCRWLRVSKSTHLDTCNILLL